MSLEKLERQGRIGRLSSWLRGRSARIRRILRWAITLECVLIALVLLPGMASKNGPGLLPGLGVTLYVISPYLCLGLLLRLGSAERAPLRTALCGTLICLSVLVCPIALAGGGSTAGLIFMFLPVYLSPLLLVLVVSELASRVQAVWARVLIFLLAVCALVSIIWNLIL